MVVGPFFFFVFGIIGIGLQFFTITSLEHGVESAARKIRTGEAQKAGKTLSDFKQMVCDAAGSYIKCDTSLVVHVQTASTWSGIVPRPCLTGGALTPASGVATDPLAGASGTASAAVLVTVCYEWKLPQSFRFLRMGDMSNGSALIQAATTFRTEPYQ
jgi:Flp pilus assembly protein TadG